MSGFSGIKSSPWQLNHLKTIPHPSPFHKRYLIVCSAESNSGREQSLQYASIVYKCGWGVILNHFEPTNSHFCAILRCEPFHFSHPTLFVTLNSFDYFFQNLWFCEKCPVSRRVARTRKSRFRRKDLTCRRELNQIILFQLFSDFVQSGLDNSGDSWGWNVKIFGKFS